MKYTMNDWDSGFVAIKNLVNNTLMFRQKLVTGTDRQPRPQSEAGQSSS